MPIFRPSALAYLRIIGTYGQNMNISRQTGTAKRICIGKIKGQRIGFYIKTDLEYKSVLKVLFYLFNLFYKSCEEALDYVDE